MTSIFSDSKCFTCIQIDFIPSILHDSIEGNAF